jgi:hypothetical protein
MNRHRQVNSRKELKAAGQKEQAREVKRQIRELENGLQAYPRRLSSPAHEDQALSRPKPGQQPRE